MKPLIDHLGMLDVAIFDSIVHIGAGQATELSTYRKLAPRRLMLVEAHPQAALDLTHRISAERGEQVIHVAVTDTDGPTQLCVFNNTGASSLRAATGLTRFFPNVRSLRTIPVPGQSLATLLPTLGIALDKNNLLILEIAGLERTVLDGADEALLQGFQFIAVRTSSEPLYEGDADEASVTARMAAIGYDMPYATPDLLPPYRELLYRRNDARVAERAAYRKLQAELAQRTREHESLREELARNAVAYGELMASANKLESTLQTSEAERSRLEQQCAEHMQLLEQQRIDHAQAMEQRCAEHAQVLESKSAQLTELSQQLETQTRNCAEQTTLATERDTQLQALAVRLRESEQRNTELQASMLSSSTRQDQLDTEILRAEAQIGLIRDLLLREPGL